MNLTPHFTFEELCRSDTAMRMGIDNTPGPEVLANGIRAANGMEKVRAVLGSLIVVHSWHRCEELERVLCAKDFARWCKDHGKPAPGAPLEQVEASWREYFAGKGHPKGVCIDFTAPAFGSPRAVVKRLKDSGIKFDQLIEEGTWVHISFDERMRGQVLTATFNNGTPTYTQGLT